MRDWRLVLLTRIVPLACLGGLVLSPRLWLSTRDYPSSPILTTGFLLPSPFADVPFVLLLAVLPLAAIAARPRKYVILCVLLAIYLVLLDQSRLQPWVYQYVFMMAGLAICAGDRTAGDRPHVFVNSCRLMVACIYFWAGLHKFNVSFVDLELSSLIEPYRTLVPRGVEVSRVLMLAVPALEVGIGIGLLTRRFRNAAVVAAVSMHCFVLLLLVPSERNSVVWPWNAAMALFSVVLFWRAEHVSPWEIVAPRIRSFQAVVAVFFGIMPCLSFVSLWDSYPSFSLYSGSTSAAGIYVDEPARQRLPRTVRNLFEAPDAYGRRFIDLNKWSLRELNVPSYPEHRIFAGVAQRLCGYAARPSEVGLVIYGKPHWWTGSRTVTFQDCSELGS